jgi:spore coat protein U-like protein
MNAQRLVLLALVVLAALLAPATARAATSCTLSSPTLSFGPVAGNQVDTMTTFTVNCTTGAVAAISNVKVRMCIGLGAGSGGSTITPQRQLANASSDKLSYQLYSDASRSTVWGSGSASSPTWTTFDLTYGVVLLGGSGGGTITLYGRYFANQVLSAGAFSSLINGSGVTFQYAYNEPLLLGLADFPASCTTPAPTAAGNSGLVTGAMAVNVNATVAPQCSAYVTTDMDFGSNVGTVAANIDRTSTIGLTCINRTAYTIGLNNGNNASGTTRRMRIGTTSYYVPYELYSNSGRTVRWGNTINTDTIPGTGTGSAQTLTVYGRVPPTGTTVPAEGSYSDIITVTITY